MARTRTCSRSNVAVRIATGDRTDERRGVRAARTYGPVREQGQKPHAASDFEMHNGMPRDWMAAHCPRTVLYLGNVPRDIGGPGTKANVFRVGFPVIPGRCCRRRRCCDCSVPLARVWSTEQTFAVIVFNWFENTVNNGGRWTYAIVPTTNRPSSLFRRPVELKKRRSWQLRVLKKPHVVISVSTKTPWPDTLMPIPRTIFILTVITSHVYQPRFRIVWVSFRFENIAKHFLFCFGNCLTLF